jgi:hypothetical protein
MRLDHAVEAGICLQAACTHDLSRWLQHILDSNDQVLFRALHLHQNFAREFYELAINLTGRSFAAARCSHHQAGHQKVEYVHEIFLPNSSQ